MPSKQITINVNDEQLKSILEKVEARLPPKPKESMTLKEVILKSKTMISKALKRGYSYDEIAAILSEEGISVKGTTIKQYLAETTKSKRRQSGTNRIDIAEESPETTSESIESKSPAQVSQSKTNPKSRSEPKVETKTPPVVRGNFATLPSNEEL